MRTVLLNLALFQAGWFVCVLGGNQAALLYTLFALFLHERFILQNGREWGLIVAVALVGMVWDMLMVAAGVLSFPGADVLGLPIWMMCLWLLFATTLNHCLAWLQRRLWLAALLAALFGPASYLAGTYLTDAQLSQPLFMSLMMMACGWSVLFPLGLYGARRLYYA